MVAEKFAAEGCNVAINYVSNAARAKETAGKVEACGGKSVVVQGVGGDFSVPWPVLRGGRVEGGGSVRVVFWGVREEKKKKADGGIGGGCV